MENFYEIFDLSPTATTDEIKKLINSQMRLWSQRTNAPQIERRQEAERMLHLLEEMENTLLDQQKRIRYDQSLRERKAKIVRSNEKEEISGVGALSQQEIEEKLQQGWQWIERGKVADALFLALQLTGQVYDCAEAWALLGKARLESGEIDEAIQPLVKACDLEPRNAKYAFTLGEVFEKQKKLDRTEEQYKRALALEPTNYHYQYKLGSLYIKNKKVQEGLRLLEQCLKEQPDNPEFQTELARGYLEAACSNWTMISPKHPSLPPGRYPIDKVDMTTAKIYIKRANAIPFKDQELRAELNRIRADIQAKKGRQFTGSWTNFILSLIAIVLINILNYSILNTAFIALPFLYLLSARTPKYLIYQKAIQGESTRTDFALLFERLKDRFGIGAYLFTPLIYLVYLPFTHFLLSLVIIYNFYRNYLIGGTKT